MKEAKIFKCYKRLINKQLLQVSGLCGTPFLSYLPKRSTQIYRAEYAILVSFQGTQTWRLEMNENIWNSLLPWERLLFARELVYIHINTPPNTWTVQTAKNHKKGLFSNETVFSQRHLDFTYWATYFENSRCCIINTKNDTELESKRYTFRCSYTWQR